MSEAPTNAVITGAASGIGLGLAREAARRGMRLVLADRDADALAAAADTLPDALAVPTDVTDPAAVERLAAAAYDRFGQVDLLFNNAGIMATGFSWEIDPARWDASLKVNVGGVLNGIRAFVPRMLRAARPARIINTASVGGFNPSPLMAPYSATKFAVVALTEALKGELDMLGAPVAVSLLAPGPVRSAIFDDPFGGTVHPATERFVAGLRGMIDQYGMDPEPFAAAVFDAIARGDYWIVPQPEALDPMLERRQAMIAARAQPSFDFLS
ncbi:SDR family NAD(P)-dependent oxidoreductase [Rhizorhabdus wittichii]|uniref:SDR family NAD(P)-dependent oxidoreductase n=1 Tax=Rhizorhabdus wittichii TaxID=160791 RepID=A0A975CYW7_9SPHN|nr:SDR family NAD(P)-dependent oxidoreductase [Rhizorhabdus wittichii]QTH19854.1 SDR family NAD(P)-dependent oxidoreductase [Rhizorhabdus wittichii]